jgi:hypothetical protein
MCLSNCFSESLHVYGVEFVAHILLTDDAVDVPFDLTD